MPYEIDDTQINLHGYGTPISFYDDNRTLRCEIYLADDNTLRVCGNPVGGGGAGAPTNHSTLSNLAADDHIQYLLKNGTRPLTGNWDAGIFDIISDTVGADSLLYAGVIVPSWKFSIGSADDTDQIGIYHDNTDAFITTDDGRFIFVTDEGANTDTYVLVRGKGTGVGHLTVHDEDNAEYVELTAVAGAGYVRVAGITPGILHIQDTAEANVTVFSSAVEGETRELLIYGFRAADAQRSLEIGVGVDAADTASFDGVSNYWFDGTVNAQTALQIGGTSINTGGTLTNVAYLDQANVFTVAQKIDVNSATAFIVEQNGVHDNVLVVDTTTAAVSIGGTLNSTQYLHTALGILTIAAGVITITNSSHTIAAQAGVVDDLDTINGGVQYQTVILQADAGDTITVKDGTGNINLNGGADFDLVGDKTLALFYDGTNWSDVGAGGGGGGVVDAADVTYTPAVVGDWDGGDPGDVADGLDELAERLKDIEDLESVQIGATWNLDGVLVALTDVGEQWVMPEDCTIVEVIASVKANGSAGNTIVDVNINGVTIFTDQGERPTIANDDADNYDVGTPAVTAITQYDEITLDIDEAATDASDLRVILVVTGLGAGGAVIGPAGATDNAIATYDGATGKLLQDSLVIIRAEGGLVLPDDADEPPLNVTERAAEPTDPAAEDIYLDDGTNTASGNPGWRRYTGAAWEDISAGAGGAYTDGARVHHNANQSINTSTWTSLALNQEDYDVGGFHDNVTNNSRLTIPEDGKYLAIFNARFAFHASGIRAFRIYLNATTAIALTMIDTIPDASFPTSVSTGVIREFDFDAGDYIEASVYQSSGGNLNLQFDAETSAYFMIQRIG